jgi:anti-sigma-K factor RskA
VKEGQDHTRWEDSAGAYLLGALPADELAGYEAHLASCEACRAEVESLKVAVDALPMSAPTVAPPAALKDRLMVEVRREAELLAAAGPAADRPAPAAQPEPRRRRWQFSLRAPLAAALAAGALGVGVLIGGVAFSGGGTRTVTASVDRTQAPRASAHLEIRGGHAVLVAEGLPLPPGGRVYEVWLQRANGAVVPTTALFTPRSNGAATAGVSASLGDVEQVLVSNEPRGGSLQPTTKPILAAKLS